MGEELNYLEVTFGEMLYAEILLAEMLYVVGLSKVYGILRTRDTR